MQWLGVDGVLAKDHTIPLPAFKGLSRARPLTYCRGRHVLASELKRRSYGCCFFDLTALSRYGPVLLSKEF